MKKIFILLAALLFVPFAHADKDGLITKKSENGVAKTIDRLEKILKEKGISVAMRWNHSEKAKEVGIDVRPTVLLVFGNPKLGSHMFTSDQTAGIDLPMKALAWKDEKGQVWLSYNDPEYIAKRHNIDDRSDIVKKMSDALKKFSDYATKSEKSEKKESK